MTPRYFSRDRTKQGVLEAKRIASGVHARSLGGRYVNHEQTCLIHCAAAHHIHWVLARYQTYMDMEMAHGAENFVIFDFGREFIISGFRLCGNGVRGMMSIYQLFLKRGHVSCIRALLGRVA
jgi:hypothetical protein